MRWSVLANTLAKVEAVGDTRGDEHALVDTLTDTLAEMEVVGNTRGDAYALV